MGLKFRRRQKLFPGVYLNFSAKGISTTIGINGFNVNVGKNGSYLNTGIPGTGIYDRTKISEWNNKPHSPIDPSLKSIPQVIPNYSEDPYYFIPKKLEGEIKSRDAKSVTSEGLAEIKETLLAAYQEKNDIEKEILIIEAEVKKAANLKLLSQIFIFGLFTNKFKEEYSERTEYLTELKHQLAECRVKIDIELDENAKCKYDELKQKFDILSKSAKIWDKTSAIKNNDNRSMAANSITRTLTVLTQRKITFINAEFDALHFKNQNGSDIFIYPAFAVLFDAKNNFGLVDLSDLNISYSLTNFLEEEGIPTDSKKIGETWAKVNKDGTPDKRFKDNFRIPILEYAEIEFRSNSGIYEVFMFSNTISASNFVEMYDLYINSNYKPNTTEELNTKINHSDNLKSYISQKQTCINGNETEAKEFNDKRIILLSSNSYKIELPDGTIISGHMTKQQDNEEGKSVYLTDKGCPIAVGQEEIFVNAYSTHNAAYIYHIK